MNELSRVAMAMIREEIIRIISTEQRRIGLDMHRLNTFKVATFRTLISWADNPDRLLEGLYEGSEELPLGKKRRETSRMGRKRLKGVMRPPIVQFGDALRRERCR